MSLILNVGNRIMNTYVYPTAVGYIMVDTGYEHSLESVTKKLKRMNLAWTDITYIFLTHAHDDHAGFLNELLYKNPQIKVIVHPEAMPILKRGQNSFDGGCSTLLAWLFCKCMAFYGKAEHRFPCIDEVHEQRFVQINYDNKAEFERLLEGEILYTPGHTKDSISLKRDNLIFCGDTAMNGFPSVKRWIIWVGDKAQLEKSWDVLLATDAEWIYPAHGKPFFKKDLLKYKNHICKMKLYSLKCYKTGGEYGKKRMGIEI